MWFEKFCFIVCGSTKYYNTFMYGKITETGNVMSKKIIIETNRELFVAELNISPKHAEEVSMQLYEIGCGRIKKISDLDDSENAYSMTVTDEQDKRFYLTMSYAGFLGIVRDSEGKYLIAPIN